MQQINTYSVFLLGKWLDSIFVSARWPLKSNIGAWQNARGILDILLSGAARLRLNESALAGATLLKKIDEVLALYQADENVTMTDEQVTAFNTAWGAFEPVLALDLNRAPIFFVTQKGIYSTPWLIQSAELAFTPAVFAVISEEARQDINQAGRCLAFEIATASGYHVVRGMEKVLREYYELVFKRSPGRRTMGKMINEMKDDKRFDRKAVAVLDQLRDLHRNPISHPGMFLDFSEAMELFDICKSAISVMARQMIRIKNEEAASTSV